MVAFLPLLATIGVWAAGVATVVSAVEILYSLGEYFRSLQPRDPYVPCSTPKYIIIPKPPSTSAPNHGSSHPALNHGFSHRAPNHQTQPEPHPQQLVPTTTTTPKTPAVPTTTEQYGKQFCEDVKQTCCLTNSVKKCDLWGHGHCSYYYLQDNKGDDNSTKPDDPSHGLDRLLQLTLVLIPVVLGLIMSILQLTMGAIFVVAIYKKKYEMLTTWTAVRYYLYIMDGLLTLMYLIAITLVSHQTRLHLIPGFVASILIPVSGGAYIYLAKRRLHYHHQTAKNT